MIISKQRNYPHHPDLFLNDEIISEVDHHTHLGVKFGNQEIAIKCYSKMPASIVKNLQRNVIYERTFQYKITSLVFAIFQQYNVIVK